MKGKNTVFKGLILTISFLLAISIVWTFPDKSGSTANPQQMEERIHSPVETDLDVYNERVDTGTSESEWSYTLQLEIGDYNYSRSDAPADELCYYPGWYYSETRLEIGEECESGACADGPYDDANMNLYFCRGPIDLLSRMKIPDSWEDDN